MTEVAADYLNRIVRAVRGAVVYDSDGYRIPQDYISVPVSPGIIRAIKAGDLEALPVGSKPPVAQVRQRRPRRVAETQAPA